MLTALRRLSHLRAGDFPALIASLRWMATARILFKVHGFDKTRLRLGLVYTADPDREPGELPRLSARTVRDLRVCLRVLEPKALTVTCLPRAIALEAVLRAHAIEADVVLGCVTGESFKAHAWVELNGHAIGWGEDGRASWTPLARFTATKA